VLIEEKERIIKEKERITEEKERVIEAKDNMIVEIRELSDIAKALTEIVQTRKPKLVQKWGERVHVFRFFNVS
jgi:HD superfamily phosphohydrolase